MVRSLANYPDVRHQISGLEHGVEKKDTEYGQFNFFIPFFIFWQIKILPAGSNFK